MNNVRGISFEIPNEYGNFLEKILLGFPIENYSWLLVKDEILLKNVTFKEFDNDIVPGNIFKKFITNEPYYIISLNVQCFESEHLAKKINNYEEFINSNCLLIVIIEDCKYVDIYVNSVTLLQLLINNVKSQKFLTFNYINNKNDIHKTLS